MKILNQIKIILLSTILMPLLIASAGFLDDFKGTGEVQKFKKACEKNDGKACFMAGKRFSDNPSEATKKEGMRMYTKGCELGDFDCCKVLADKNDYKAAIRAGDISKDRDTKIWYYGHGCMGGEAKGCENLCTNKLVGGKVDGCMEMAYLAGKKTSSSEANEEQIKWWLKACENGNEDGCANAGLNTKDPAESSRLLKIACDKLNPRACYILGFRAREKGDLKSAENFYLNACSGKFYEDSCEILKEIRKEIADISDQKIAAQRAPLLAKLKADCDKGDLNGCFQHGLQMVAPANQKIPWFKKACDGGNFDGCFQMGSNFEDLVQLNDAIKAYIQSCEGGNSPGCFKAGQLSEKGNRPADAKKYFLKSCELGHALACNNLGNMEYQKGNKAEAVLFYNKACDGGNTAGCTNLAGIQLDWSNITEARKYLNQACDSGSNAACQKLVALTKGGW